MTNPSFSVDACCAEGERQLKSGAPLVAYDVLAEGLRHEPAHVRLRQLIALAMARSGASRDANAILRQLASEGHADEETLGLLARTHKDIALEAATPEERQANLSRAFTVYRDAFNASGGYWSGINAATMAVLLGQRDAAAAIAADVRERCRRLIDEDPRRHDRYWVLATLGEAALVLGAFSEASDWYSEAAAASEGRHGDLVSTRRNARLLLKHLGKDTRQCDACFDIPTVVVFAGHLVDKPGRTVPRFPHEIEPAVRRAIDETVAALKPGFGYASAASGGDILFLESVVKHGGAAHVVLPFNRDQFREESVDVIPGSNWPARFDRVLDEAAEIVLASDHPIGDGMSFEYGFRLLDGSARIKADELETDLVCVALWDGAAGDGPGGTASSVDHWRRTGSRVEIIDLAALRGATPAPPPPPATPSHGRLRDAFDSEIVGLLFADAMGFSKLTEPEIPLFVEHYLGAIAGVLARAGCSPLQVNTWGDGLYLVFDSVAETGALALALRDTVRSIDWRALGFRKDLSVRIGLHAGPAYSCVDPVTDRRNYLGAHVSRAARIEPIAPPGEVYASGAFAALARADPSATFRCMYVGQTPLAKGYGTFPTYVVRPSRRPTTSEK